MSPPSEQRAETVTEFQKMTSGELYDAFVPELITLRAEAKRKCHLYNSTIGYSEDVAKRQDHLTTIMGKVGRDCVIEPPFRVDYGSNIEIGERFYANFDCVILDW